MAETHREIVERMTEFWQYERNNRDDALDDLKFRAGDQWPDTVRRQREADGKPILTINRIPQFIKRVSGDLRKSHPSIVPIPVHGDSDEQLTELIAGLVRHVEYASNAGAAYSYAAECAITCGIGHIQIGTKFLDGSFDQDVTIDRVLDPLSVIWDAKAVKLDRSDADECFVTEWISPRDRASRFKVSDSNGGDIPLWRPSQLSTLYWKVDDRIRIASRWWREKVKKKLGINEAGQVFDITDMPRAKVKALGVVRDRDAEDYVVKTQILDGNDFLTGEQKWAGRFIPIVPVIGEEVSYDNNLVRHGIVRWAKDPQRLYNYWRTAAAEMIALAPKAPFIVPMKSIAGLENFWNKANQANLPYLPYNPIEGQPNLRPERSAPPAPPAAMWQEANVAQDDMKATTGIYDAALGNRSNETSGVAIQARQDESETGTFVYFDNFNHAIQRVGQILVDLIPKVYDGERIQRIIGEDGKESFVPINKSIQSVDGPIILNDLSAAQYDVRIKVGPSYQSAMDEAKSELGDLMQSNPQWMQLFGDLYIESLAMPPGLKQKMADRVKRTIPPQVLGPEDAQEAGVQPPPPDPMQQMSAQIALKTGEAKLALTQAQADNFTLKNEQIAEQLGLHPNLGQIPLTMPLPMNGAPSQPRPMPIPAPAGQ